MWLPVDALTTEEALAEFDQWVTPSLGDIRDTDRYAEELDTLHAVLLAVADRVESGGQRAYFATLEILKALIEGNDSDRAERVAAIVTTLFLVTAKSDNAVKCQFPIWLRSKGRGYPSVRSRAIRRGSVPTVLKSVDVVRNVVAVAGIDQSVAAELLIEYVEFLLSEPRDVPQLEAIVSAVGSVERQRPGGGRDLLAPLVSFQVRGSVAASGGHDPEQIVRRYLTEWGLEPGVHFNLTDITAATLSNWLVAEGDSGDGSRQVQVATGDKTRAFDFVLPCYIVNASKRVFVQSQFYAGDSGSVSHKNVDQAGVARAAAALLFPDARFVELVDGAGYCASLRKDLQHLLFAPDTDDFVQLRSIPVRLRRILQSSGIASPLDIAVRVYEGLGQLDDLLDDLRALEPAIDPESAITNAVAHGWLRVEGDRLRVSDAVASTVEKYAILDSLVEARRPVDQSATEWLLVPGFGANIGVPSGDDRDRDVVAELVEEGLVIRLRTDDR